MANKETKREKFVRLSEARTNKAVHMIQLIGNCSNTALYEYSDEDIEKIYNALNAEIKTMKKRFDASKISPSNKFTL